MYVDMCRPVKYINVFISRDNSSVFTRFMMQDSINILEILRIFKTLKPIQIYFCHSYLYVIKSTRFGTL